MDYNLVLTHDVTKAEYLGNDTVKYVLVDGRVYTIKFGEREGGIVTRDVWDDQGRHFYEEEEFTFYKEDYAQWTADNIFEVEETFEGMEEQGLWELKLLAEG